MLHAQFTFFLIFLMSLIVDGVSVTLLAKRLKFGALSNEKNFCILNTQALWQGLSLFGRTHSCFFSHCLFKNSLIESVDRLFFR